MHPPVIHWFRRDLRLADNLALHAALQSGAPVLPVFILDPAIIVSPKISLPRLSFLLAALAALDADLRQQGSCLWLAYGNPSALLPELVRSTAATALYYNRDYSPFALKRDANIDSLLTIPVHIFDDALLLPPGTVMTEAGKPFTVFTPFKRKWLTVRKQSVVDSAGQGAFIPLEDIDRIAVGARHAIPDLSNSIPTLADLGLPSTIAVPPASAAVALQRMDDFLSQRVYTYGEGRNRLAALTADDTYNGSSFLSPYLRFGLLSPRQAYWGARTAYQNAGVAAAQSSVETWVSELVWREFYMHILYHFPHVARGSFRPQYDNLAWYNSTDDIAAWKAGVTGYPVVDAAMRQLQAMGWMPNRARMIVASFLTKDLLIDWRVGERHFMDWLIDGDPAANNGGWQWSAGTGTDAQPYFRIFNPISQSQKFDPDGLYLRRWLPELRDVPDKYIHAPWEMSTPPAAYPRPIVNHAAARQRTLDAFKAVGKGEP
ncbi:MAG: deoxyribodipyrimidine photo-lyase [Anaerolineae bacterium]